MARADVTEQQVAELVVAYLELLGADVYQEVEVSGGVADIVARVGAELWIVEVKTTLSLALVAQAMERRRLAHRVYIAAPRTRNQREVTPLLAEIGVGFLEVSPGAEGVAVVGFGYGQPAVRELVESRRWNTRPVALAQDLAPEHKTHARAGAVGAGGRWTPFRNTCEQLARAVRDVPGITLKAAIDGLRHHYASNSAARSRLAKWAEAGKVPGVRLQRIAGAVTLHPAAGP